MNKNSWKKRSCYLRILPNMIMCWVKKHRRNILILIFILNEKDISFGWINLVLICCRNAFRYYLISWKCDCSTFYLLLSMRVRVCGSQLSRVQSAQHSFSSSACKCNIHIFPCLMKTKIHILCEQNERIFWMQCIPMRLL